MLDAYIYNGLRTPFGRHAGALARMRPDDMLASVISAVVEQSPFDPAKIEDVVVGCANQAGEDSRCVGRHAGLLAGLPIEVAGLGIAAQLRQRSQRDRYGGAGRDLRRRRFVCRRRGRKHEPGAVCDEQGRDPVQPRRPRVSTRRSARAFRTRRSSASLAPTRCPRPPTIWRATTRSPARRATSSPPPRSANTPPERLQASLKAKSSPVEVPGGRAGPVKVAEDEHPRPQTDLAALAKLRPLQDGGVTTAGNASGINDGAVAMIVASRKAGDAAGAKPLARVVASGVAGVPPRIMGIGPVEASKKALARAGLSLSDIDVIEINEAFASQVLSCLRGLELPFDDSRVNMNGGAIAVGHPLGASGPRIALTAARQLERTGGRYALVTMCVGVGQGIAAVLERVQ